jgi:cold-inducible RNA-binding protein
MRFWAFHRQDFGSSIRQLVSALRRDAVNCLGALLEQQFETRSMGTIMVGRAGRQKTTDMGTKLFVGNLSFEVTENDLQDLFAQAGAVTSVNLMQDRETGRPRGFGFVEMATEADTAKAISMLNGKDFKGRALTVNEARPREERGGGGGGGYRGGGGRDRGYDGRR